MTAVLVVALTGTTALAAKPSVAILGLEVVDPTGNVDLQSIQVAKELTDGMRNRAKAGSGPYQLVAGGDKELIDEKLIHNCDNEAIPCMAEIGKNLGADYLIYGRLEKRADGYVVTINLLNVSKKKFEKAKTPLAITQRDSATLAGLARRAYNDLTGITEMGTLVVTANADRGTVLLDDAPKGTLTSGTATITGLAEGRYRLVIEADGYKRSSEEVVTVRSGETATQAVTLEVTTGGGKPFDIGGTTSSTKTNIWKPVFYVSLVAAVGLGGFSTGAFVHWKGLVTDGEKAGTLPAGFNQSDCKGDPASDAMKDVCTWRGRNITTGIIAGAVGVVVVGSAYMAFFRGSSERPAGSAVTGRRSRKDRQFSVTPIVSPEGGGATVQFDW